MRDVSFATGSSIRGAFFVLHRVALCGVLFLTVCVCEAPAQEMEVGGRLGPAFGFLNDSAIPFISAPGQTEAGANVRIDINAGLHAVIPLTDQYAIQPELLFVKKGGHLTRSDFAERYRISYIQAHLLGRRDISVPGPLSIHVVAGVTGAVATGGRVERDVRIRSIEWSERIALVKSNLVRRWDVGGLVGGGVGYPVAGAGTIALSFRYNPGFRTIFTDEQRPASEQRTIGSDPPPLTDTPPSRRHDVILVSVSYTRSLEW